MNRKMSKGGGGEWRDTSGVSCVYCRVSCSSAAVVWMMCLLYTYTSSIFDRLWTRPSLPQTQLVLPLLPPLDPITVRTDRPTAHNPHIHHVHSLAQHPLLLRLLLYCIVDRPTDYNLPFPIHQIPNCFAPHRVAPFFLCVDCLLCFHWRQIHSFR